MDERVYDWMNGWMGGRVYGLTERCVYNGRERCMHRWMDGWACGGREGEMHGSDVWMCSSNIMRMAV